MDGQGETSEKNNGHARSRPRPNDSQRSLGQHVLERVRGLDRLGLLRCFVPLFLLGVTLWLFDRPWGLTPSLGRVLQPVRGLWRAPDDAMSAWPEKALAAGLRERVVVRVDPNRIAHVFAANDEDLYFTQGFLVASERLWQMDFVTRVAAGRLSEIMGRRTLDIDRLFVKIGLPQAAADSLEQMLRDDLTRTAIEAYARGVNAYIKSLAPDDLPFEYKLLSATPEEWTPLKTALLLKFMAHQLSFWSTDLALTRSLSRLNEDDFNALFPVQPDVRAPIVPKGGVWSFKSSAPPPPKKYYQVDLERVTPMPTPNPANGSNNWALSGSKSSTGNPIVSNDVHLSYGLPSLWYQVQLRSPTQNVYGVTIPGAPGVILGFNSDVAWAVTNGGSDILDFFDLRFRDDSRTEYLHGGAWRPVISRDHEIKVRGQNPEKLTLKQTHFGPLVYDESETPLNPMIPRGLAMRWGALAGSNELRTFLLLNRAKTFADCQDSLEKFQSPGQNVICADKRGDIGITHQGLFPLRWRGQGRLISDGSDPLYDWNGQVPPDELPFVLRPSRGFVSSANQAPAAPDYPHYLGWSYDGPFRAARIEEILSSQVKFTPEEMVSMQADSLLPPARDLTAIFLARVPRAKLSVAEAKALELLKDWDHRMEPESAAAVVFDKWWTLLQDAIWSDQFPDRKYYYWPRPHRTAELIRQDPDSKWFDRIETEERETLASLLAKTLSTAVEELSASLGPDPAAWQWQRYQPAIFPHVSRIPGLGHAGIGTRGHQNSIFANRGDHGPVWKSVVALGSTPRAWGVYPGGQSGHPASRFYDNFLSDWASGRMPELVFLKGPEDSLQAELRLFRLEPSKAGSHE